MSFSPPSGVAFYTPDDLDLTKLSAALRSVAAFLQALQPSSPPLRLYHDWWEHDGLHFDQRRITFHDLFAMIQTPRSLFESTPQDHEVFVGVAPEDMSWYLRFRADWDADGRDLAGTFAVIVSSAVAEKFRQEIAVHHSLAEAPSDVYYQQIIV